MKHLKKFKKFEALRPHKIKWDKPLSTSVTKSEQPKVEEEPDQEEEKESNPLNPFNTNPLDMTNPLNLINPLNPFNIIKQFDHFRNPYFDKRVASNKPPKFIGDIAEPVEIRIDVEAVTHALDRQYRHGVTTGETGKIDAGINKDEILDTIEGAVEQITIALMQDKFNINQDEDDYPTRGVRAGEPNRFVIKNKENDLNIVCQLESGENEFTLTVITVMKKPDFRAYQGQFVVEV